MEEISIIIFGLVIGSFINVVIFRLPRRQSIILPRSRCQQCQASIAFYDNIPIISYILLRGKCRTCHCPISIQYPLVEAFTAFSFWLALRFFGLSVYTGFSCLFISLLIILAIIDLRHMILPDVLTIGGTIVFFIYTFFNPNVTLLDGILSALGGALLFGGLFFYYLKIRKIEGIGFGDVKMVFFLGAFLGHRNLVITILLASFFGLLVGLYFILFKGKNLKYALPFGTFLGMGSYISLFWGDEIFNTLFRLFNLHA